MNVLLIHQLYADDREPGGTRHFELAKRLVQYGHEVAVVTSDRCYFTGKRRATGRQRGGNQQRARKRRETYQGVTVIQAATLPTWHWGLLGKVFAYLSFMITAMWTARKVKQIDVVLATSPPIFQLLPAWLLASWRRRPFVLEIRDLWPAFAIDMGVLRNRWIIRLAEWTERVFYRQASRIIVNSPAYVEYLLELGIAREIIRLIPNGVDPQMLQSPTDTRTSARDAFGLNGEFVVTYAGALGLANDIDTMVNVADQLRHDEDIRLLVLGNGLLQREIAQQIFQRELANVTLSDVIAKGKMAELLNASDACLATLRDIPMFRMTYPNKVFDYMAAGRPVVLAIDGVIRDVVASANGGICVPPGDAQAIADAIRYLRDHPAEAQSMGHSGFKYVAKHFHRDDHARLLEQTLEEVAA